MNYNNNDNSGSGGGSNDGKWTFPSAPGMNENLNPSFGPTANTPSQAFAFSFKSASPAPTGASPFNPFPASTGTPSTPFPASTGTPFASKSSKPFTPASSKVFTPSKSSSKKPSAFLSRSASKSARSKKTVAQRAMKKMAKTGTPLGKSPSKTPIRRGGHGPKHSKSAIKKKKTKNQEVQAQLKQRADIVTMLENNLEKRSSKELGREKKKRGNEAKSLKKQAQLLLKKAEEAEADEKALEAAEAQKKEEESLVECFNKKAKFGVPMINLDGDVQDSQDADDRSVVTKYAVKEDPYSEDRRSVSDALYDWEFGIDDYKVNEWADKIHHEPKKYNQEWMANIAKFPTAQSLYDVVSERYCKFFEATETLQLFRWQQHPFVVGKLEAVVLKGNPTQMALVRKCFRFRNYDFKGALPANYDLTGLATDQNVEISTGGDEDVMPHRLQFLLHGYISDQWEAVERLPELQN